MPETVLAGAAVLVVLAIASMRFAASTAAGRTCAGTARCGLAHSFRSFKEGSFPMRGFLATIVGAALAIAALAPIAAAVEPTREDFSFSDTAVLADVCPFPVTVELTGTGTETVFFDKEGNVTRVQAHVVEQDVFTANGKTLVGLPFRFNFQILIDPETGEATNVFASGVFSRVPLPGGDFFLTAGRADFIANGESFLIQPDVGAQGNIAGFCAALAP